MFTKEKLVMWIDNIEIVITDLQRLYRYTEDDEIEVEIEILRETKHTLEQLYTSINSDNSI